MIIPLVAAGGAAVSGGVAAGGVAGLFGLTGITATIVNVGVGTALALGASFVAAKLTPQPKQPKPSDGSVEFKQPLPPRFFTYGKVKISGPVLLLELNDQETGPWSGDSVRLLKIVAFGTRELAFMDPFYLDGTALTLAAGVGSSDGSFINWTYSGSHGGVLRTHLGQPSQAADTMLMELATFWTSAHRLRGIPYAAAELESVPATDWQEAFPNGESNFACVGGVRLYDPRKDSTNGGSGSHRMTDQSTWEFSDNQRLAALDWITWPDGYGKAWSRIDWASWVPQINLADENVALKAGGTEKRYRIATRVSYDEPRSRVLHRIMQAGDQQLYTTANGLIGSRGGVWQTPTVDLAVERFPEAHFTHGVPTLDRINEFQLTAMLPEKDYAEYDLEPWAYAADPDHVAGIIRRAPLDLSQVPSNAQAQRLAKIYMSKRNPRWSGEVRTTFAGLDALGQSAVNLSFAELDVPDDNFNGPFWVNGKVSFLPDRTGLTFPVASADPSSYDWDSDEENPIPGDDPEDPGGPLPPDPGEVITPPAISGLTKVGEILTVSNGTYSHSPTSYSYKWYNEGGGEILGSEQTHVIGGASEFFKIRASVFAQNVSGKTVEGVAPVVGPVSPA